MGGSAWIGPVVGAAIALAGVGVTQLFTLRSRHEDRRWKLEDEMRKLLIDRGEELYSLVRKWWINQIEWYGNCKLCMKGVIDYNTFLDRYIQSNEGVNLQVERIDLIFSIYLPEIEGQWNECIKSIRAASSIENDFMQDYKGGMFSGEQRLTGLNAVMLKADEQVEATLASIAATVRSRTVK